MRFVCRATLYAFVVFAALPIGGVRIDAAAQGVPGPVIRAATANATISAPLTLDKAGQTLYLAPGITTFSAPITLAGQGSSIRCEPNSVATGPSLAGGCYLQEAPGANLPVAIAMTGDMTSLSNVTVDGQQFAGLMYATVTHGGSGYTSGVRPKITGCATAPIVFFPVVGGSLVANANGETLTRGSGCTSPAPTCTIAGGGGTGATCTVTFGPNLNPKAGGCIWITGIRVKLDTVNAMRCGTNFGAKAGSEAATNAGAAFTVKNSMFQLNEGPNLYMVNVADWFIGEHTEFENGMSENVRACDAASGRWGTYDIGGGNDVGLYIGGVASGFSGTFNRCTTLTSVHPLSSNWMMVADGQFGGNLKQDILIDGYDTVHGGPTVLYEQIGGASFTGGYAKGVLYKETYAAIEENGGGQNIYGLDSFHDDFGNGALAAAIRVTDPGGNELLPDMLENNLANLNVAACYVGMSNSHGQTMMNSNLCNGQRFPDTGQVQLSITDGMKNYVVVPAWVHGYAGGAGDRFVQLGDGTGMSGHVAVFDAAKGLTNGAALGTMASQNANSIAVTNPTINGITYDNATPLIAYSVSTKGCGAAPTGKKGTSIDEPSAIAGSFVAQAAGACSATLTFTVNAHIPAPSAWSCDASDVSNGTKFAQSSVTSNSCTISGTTTGAHDEIVFSAHMIH